ncbi:MAG TPA: PDZ domain-containing protein [Pyrinomonadaceae bacterium]|nr:PDZ domain-containing protein [Pyrinomonadaceae bacterium]
MRQRGSELLAPRGAAGRMRVGVALFAFCAFGAHAALVVSAQETRPPRRAPLPVAATPAKPPARAQAKIPADTPPVIAVVHRMSGWKLRTLLTPADATAASAFDENFVRTNIVAGFIMSDGRSVVARLPQAEAEMLNLSTAFRAPGLLNATGGDAELLLVRPDGAQFRARFIGFDASTGLSLLESDKLLFAPASEAAHVQPVVGQRVRVIAPVRAALPVAAPTVPPAPSAPPVSPSATAPRPEGAPVGEEGVIYMNMDEEAGHLREVKRSPSGKALEMTVEVEGVSPEWAGGVALSETGMLVGIVEESDARRTRLMSAETVRSAARRVSARRASVPQPWLGARGDALGVAPLEQLLARGWPLDEARLLVSQQRGVLLTSVAPGTPAARAGLRPGDVVSRIGRHDVRSVEDMSSVIKELGGNTLANFKVLRAQSAPLNLPVRLSESPSPGLDTARAELRAAQADLRMKQFDLRTMSENVRRFETALRQFEIEGKRLAGGQPPDAARLRLQEELERVRAQHRQALEQSQKISADFELVRARVAEAEARYRAASEAYNGLAVKPLLTFGLEAMRFSPTAAANVMRGANQKNGLLVMSVRPGSVAAQSKIQPGDIIESINGQFLSDTGWNFPADFDTDLSLGILRAGEKFSFNLSRQNSPQ